MKKIVFFCVSSLCVFSAYADTAPVVATSEDKVVLQCSVPVQSGQAQVAAAVTIGSDLSQDFVTITLKDIGQELVFFTQLKKGQLDSDLKSGGTNFLLLTEETSQEAGVIRKAGFFAVGKEADGSFGGFISAVGNVYPLSCVLK